MQKIKFRVEEHYNNCDTYMLHGIYNNLQQAKNKKAKVSKENNIKEENLFIVKITTIKEIVKE